VRRAIALFPLVLVVAAGCGGGDDDAEPEQGARTQATQTLPAQLQELKDTGINIELSRADVRAARAAIREIEAQAEGAARVPASVTDMDLLPSEQGAAFLFDGGYIDRGAFCNAVSTVGEIDAYGTLDGEVVELDDKVAGDRFAAKFNAAAPEGINDMGATMYNALSVGCL
jgi:hypothetical protein